MKILKKLKRCFHKKHQNHMLTALMVLSTVIMGSLFIRMQVDKSGEVRYPLHAQTPVACGVTISANTTLDADLTGCADGLVIDTSGITLDCAGYTISGLGSGNGVVFNASNAGLQNCVIESFNYGVLLLSSSSDNTLSGNTIFNNNRDIYNFNDSNSGTANACNTTSGWPENGSEGCTNTVDVTDTDSDGVIDLFDLDDDNDGIPDIEDINPTTADVVTGWELAPSGVNINPLNDVHCSGFDCVAVGDGGTVLFGNPTDGWAPVTSNPTAEHLNGVHVFENGEVVVVGDNGTVMFGGPTVGDDWNGLTSAPNVNFHGIDCNDSGCAIVGDGTVVGEGTVMFGGPTVGDDWASASVAGTNLRDVHMFSDGTVTAVGEGGTVMFGGPTVGDDWNGLASAPNVNFYGIDCNDSGCAIVGDGTIMFGGPGVKDENWIVAEVTDVDLHDVHMFNDGKVTVVGSTANGDGTVMFGGPTVGDELTPQATAGTDLNAVHMLGSGAGWIVGEGSEVILKSTVGEASCTIDALIVKVIALGEVDADINMTPFLAKLDILYKNTNAAINNLNAFINSVNATKKLTADQKVDLLDCAYEVIAELQA